MEEYCEKININSFNDEENFLNQVSVLKSLINRKVYSLTDKQIGIIHRKFKNFCLFRKQKVYNLRK